MIDVIPLRIEFDRSVNFGPGVTVDHLLGAAITDCALAEGWLMLRLSATGTVHAVPSARIHCIELQPTAQAPVQQPIVVPPPNGRHDSTKPGQSSQRRR